jgi:hypothetical protein
MTESAPSMMELLETRLDTSGWKTAGERGAAGPMRDRSSSIKQARRPQ